MQTQNQKTKKQTTHNKIQTTQKNYTHITKQQQNQ